MSRPGLPIFSTVQLCFWGHDQMMFDYRESVSYSAAEMLSPEDFCRAVTGKCNGGWRMLAFFGVPAGRQPELACILCHAGMKKLDVLRCVPQDEYPSVTPGCPQAHLFEREIFEQWNIVPAGHPWLKPVRFCPPVNGSRDHRPGPANALYFQAEGYEVHEVAVGPVHAGVIEPGHFRFQCRGENVLHLEIQLGFQHRDAEYLILTSPPSLVLPVMENIAGDSAIGHATAYCTLLEKLTHTDIPKRAHLLRRVALELERLANHTRDLGAIGGDTGFLPTSAWNGRITGDFLNITSELCGSRFGRNMICPGGVKWDVDEQLALQLIKRLRSAWRDVRGSVDVMLASSSVLTRLTGTGRVSQQAAKDLGLVGVAAKACGIAMDARNDWPLYPLDIRTHAHVHDTGDVLARTLVRSDEVDDSAAACEADLQYLSYTSGEEPCRTGMDGALPADRLAVSQVEGWRGEICHVGITDPQGRWLAYKVIDPSFHNWTGLAMALRGEQISDFPLCNKSFNLSYCGHDL